MTRLQTIDDTLKRFARQNPTYEKIQSFTDSVKDKRVFTELEILEKAYVLAKLEIMLLKEDLAEYVY